MKKINLYEEAFIKDLGVSTKTKNVLLVMKVHTLADLHLRYLLNSFPKEGTFIKHHPHVNMESCYSPEVNEEIKEILRDYYGIEELEHVGA